MDSKILMEMSDIQMELAGCTGLIAVIADGLSAVPGSAASPAREDSGMQTRFTSPMTHCQA